MRVFCRAGNCDLCGRWLDWNNSQGFFCKDCPPMYAKTASQINWLQRFITKKDE